MTRKFRHLTRYVCRQTGLTAHQIRAWEKRYQAVVPERTETNRRLYSEADIERLQLLAKAREAKLSLSQVAHLPADELMRLIDISSSNVLKPLQGSKNPARNAVNHYEEALATVVDLDATGLEDVLDQAAVNLTRLELINDVVMPLSLKLFELVDKGHLRLINAHQATNVMRSFLWNMLRSTKISALSPKIVVTTPPGLVHELGALVIALLASESGWRALYFGPGLPAEETAAAVLMTKAHAVVLYAMRHAGSNQLSFVLSKLHRCLGGDIAIFIGGQFDTGIAGLFETGNVHLFEDGRGFRETLENLLASRQRCHEDGMVNEPVDKQHYCIRFNKI